MNDEKLGAIARVKISEKEIDISGPVDFVERQIDKQFEILKLFAESIKSKNSLQYSKVDNTPVLQENTNSQMLIKSNVTDYADYEEVEGSKSFFEKYVTVFAINNDKIQFLSNIPGASLPKRMVNLIVMYMCIKLQMKVERVSFSEIRDVCEMHGELDAAHFAVIIRKNKKFFLIEGTGKSFYAKLTVPGIKEAENLLNSLK